MKHLLSPIFGVRFVQPRTSAMCLMLPHEQANINLLEASQALVESEQLSILSLQQSVSNAWFNSKQFLKAGPFKGILLFQLVLKNAALRSVSGEDAACSTIQQATPWSRRDSAGIHKAPVRCQFQ